MMSSTSQLEVAHPLVSPPQVTWLLCTHQDDFLLHRAIRSCLTQTLTDFELLIVVNGPDVNRLVPLLTQAYVHDARVRVVGTSIRMLNFSLSLGLHLARAPFIARMDADDISHPERLAHQLAFMQTNHHVAVLGTCYYLVDQHNCLHGTVDVPKENRDILSAIRFRNPFCHPSVMLRREAVLTVGAYLGGRNAEDYDLWLRLAMTKEWQFANLPDYLLSYNISLNGAARRSREAYANMAGAQLRQFLVTKDIRWFMGSFISAGKAFFLANKP